MAKVIKGGDVRNRRGRVRTVEDRRRNVLQRERARNGWLGPEKRIEREKQTRVAKEIHPLFVLIYHVQN
ncbi:hypothetical protein ACLOJK_013895 [Asimina triloba]